MNDKTSGTPDAASASMAYMPGSRAADAEADNELRIDKKAEKKTMADIASELGAQEATSTSAGVKVAVGEATATSAKKVAKAEATPPPAPEPELESEPISNSAEPSRHGAHDKPTPSKSPRGQKPGRGRRVFIALIVLLLLGASGVLGYLWWQGRDRAASLQGELDAAEASQKSLQSQLDAASRTEDDTAEAAIPAGSTRTIPELGLSYGLTITTKKVSYAYSEVNDDAGVVHSVLSFSSTDLVAAERKVAKTGTEPACLAANAPLGKLTSYKAGDTVSGGKASALKVDSKTNFKLGETYYVFTAAQGTCSSNSTVQSAQTAAKAYVAELLASLTLTK